jgi:hypothetical protein
VTSHDITSQRHLAHPALQRLEADDGELVERRRRELREPLVGSARRPSRFLAVERGKPRACATRHAAGSLDAHLVDRRARVAQEAVRDAAARRARRDAPAVAARPVLRRRRARPPPVTPRPRVAKKRPAGPSGVARSPRRAEVGPAVAGRAAGRPHADVTTFNPIRRMQRQGKQVLQM